MSGRTSASGRAGVQDWVDSNLFEDFSTPSILETKTKHTIQDSAFELKFGCEVHELDFEDTIPSELMEYFE